MSSPNGQIEQVVARLADQVERRYYGKYRGFVVDNEDPENLGRLKVKVPSVLGDEVVTGWAVPCVPSGGTAGQGHLFVPDVDAGVWVEFEEGDPEFPIWVGCFWSAPGGESEVPPPVDADGAAAGEPQSPPTRKIIRTARGHTLQFEDGDEPLRIVLADGDEENRIVFSDDGISIVNNDNIIEMTSDGVQVIDANGNTVTMDSSGVTVDAGSNEVVLLGGTVKVGDAMMEQIIQGTTFMQNVQTFLISLATHTHVGNMGAPTSPPTSSFSLDVPLSNHLVE